MVAQTRRGRPWWSGAAALLCQVVGAGMSFNTLLALARATRRGGEFVRTPKYRIVERGQEWGVRAYVRVGDPRPAIEGKLGLPPRALVPAALPPHPTLVHTYPPPYTVPFP